jgi:nucleotide-binding universal stress UspA family protein
MYRNILVATDGSRLATKGVREAVGLAKALGARLYGLYVVAPSPAVYGESAAYYAAGFTPAEYKKLAEKAALKALHHVEQAARSAGVRCTTRFLTDAQPWRGILRAASAERCDAIVMTSHGRSSIGGMILGSETTRVLARSRIPVLVAR